MRRREFLATAAAAVVLPVSKMAEAASERHLLYIAEPGIRNYVEYGGVGVLVYDIGAVVQVRQAHSHVDSSGRSGAGERQGRRCQREDGPHLRHHHQANVRDRPGHGEDRLGGGARGRVRSPRNLSGRDDALCAVARGSSLARDERAGRKHHQEDRHGLRRAQHRVLPGWQRARTSPG